MRKINDFIDRYCILHPNFGIRNLMKYYVISAGVLWILDMISNGAATAYLCFRWDLVCAGQFIRLFTFMLLPEGGGFFLLISLYFYYFIGNALESHWGSGKFTIYFFSGAILSLVFTIVYSLITHINYPLIGISFVLQAMFFAFAVLYGEAQVLLFFFIPIKVKWLAIAEAVLYGFSIITSLFAHDYYNALLPIVALLNFFIYFSPYFLKKKKEAEYMYSRKHSLYREAVNRQKKSETKSLYHHKCSVCGKTDTEFPNLQFRYCSKCSGYHCFCQDHIFSHVHFQE